jgi:hypothetical protein
VRLWALLWVVVGVLSCRAGATPTPRIDSVEPSRIVHGSAAKVSIFGHHFRTGVDVELDSPQAAKVDRAFAVWLGHTRIADSAVTYAGPNQLAIDVPPTLAVGAYDVKVTTPSGRSASLPQGLTVVDSPVASSSPAAGGATSVTPSGYSDPTGGSAALPAATGGVPDVSRVSGGAAGEGGAGGLRDRGVGADAASVAPEAGEPGSGGTMGSGGSEPGGAGQPEAGVSTGSSGSAGSDTAVAAAGATDAGGEPIEAHPTLWTDGRLLKDTCGRVVTLRGVEQRLTSGVPASGWTGMMQQIGATGANAVRVIPDMAGLTASELDAAVATLHGQGMITLLAGLTFGWLSDNRAMLAKYSDRLILDVWLAAYDDRARFARDAQAAVEQVRSYGYTEPLVVSSNDYGKDLPALLEFGETLLLADPAHNLVFGWDAYWGSSNRYQNLYGMSLSEGISSAAAASFPVIMALTQYPDGMFGESVAYADAMAVAQSQGVSWLWATWYNPPSAVNALSSDGTFDTLSALGVEVVTEHVDGIARSSQLACQGS